MPRISLPDYWMGRDLKFAAQLSPRIRANAELLVERVNKLLSRYSEATGDDEERRVNSGWRPPAVNAAVKNAKPRSRHLTGEAGDLGDDDESLDTWLMTEAGQKALEECELWMEHPDATPRWCHLQCAPPGSGRRVFFP